jgi:hypothetical protein
MSFSLTEDNEINYIKLFRSEDGIYKFVLISNGIGYGYSSLNKNLFTLYDKEFYSLLKNKGTTFLIESRGSEPIKSFNYISDDLSELFISYEDFKLKLFSKKMNITESTRMMENVQFLTLLDKSDYKGLITKFSAIVLAYEL